MDHHQGLQILQRKKKYSNKSPFRLYQLSLFIGSYKKFNCTKIRITYYDFNPNMILTNNPNLCLINNSNLKFSPSLPLVDF